MIKDGVNFLYKAISKQTVANPTALSNFMNVCKYSGIAICVANVIEEVYQLSKDGKFVKHVVNISIVLACTSYGAIFGPVGTLIGALVGTAIRLIMNKLNK